jgi:hypothetical protein
MKLIFYGRQTTPAPAPGTGLLTIERKGVFSFSTAAVQALGLTTDSELVLAADEETNQWFVLLQVPEGEKSFTLRPRDRNKSGALVFHSQPQARTYWAAHQLEGQKSVHTLVSATAIEQDGVKLYPLTPQHATKTLEVPTPEEPTTVASPSAPAEPVTQPDVVPLATDLPHLQAEQPATLPTVDSTPAPVSSVPVLAPGQLPTSRGEQLADYWNERDISKATPNELEEVLKVLGAMPRADRGFTENKVLNQAKTEQAKRLKEAGKKGATA